MNKIFLLDDLTINKIAAGEVVERPASVVKELVENSIDANSKRINIEISDGGKEFILISDDGDGILPEDVPLAFQRHSTSKLRQIEDIQSLYTNGFRGEALSSIAAVSKVELLTNIDDSNLGKKLLVEDGEIKSIQDVGMKKGTIIRVKDLFYNLPARKKFLKSSSTETLQINEILSKLAIVNADIAFRYSSNGREVFSTVGDGEMLNAITAIYGKSISSSLISVNYKSPYLKIDGYVSKTGLYQSNRKKETIYFNRRYVKNSPLIYTIENIYKDLIPIGKYPVFFIRIEMSPSLIDPNVHPSKLEIKLSNEIDIATPLSECIREALFRSSRNMIPEAMIKSTAGEKPFRYAQAVSNQSTSNIGDGQNSEYDLQVHENEALYSGNSFEYKEYTIDPNHANESSAEVIIHNEHKPDEQFQHFFPSQHKNVVIESSVPPNQESIFTNESVLDYTKFKTVGVVMGTYIVVTLDESMFLIDQHAAHERIMYEKFLEELNLEDSSRHFSSQELLVAELQEFSTIEHEVLLKNADLFHRLGYTIEDFGFNRIAIRSFPIFFDKAQGIEFFMQVSELILEEKKLSLNEYFNDKIAKMACKSAIKANQIIKEQEIELLFTQLNQCQNKYTCPHGRPIFVEWKKKEIEKMFKRIV